MIILIPSLIQIPHQFHTMKLKHGEDHKWKIINKGFYFGMKFGMNEQYEKYLRFETIFQQTLIKHIVVFAREKLKKTHKYCRLVRSPMLEGICPLSVLLSNNLPRRNMNIVKTSHGLLDSNTTMH